MKRRRRDVDQGKKTHIPSNMKSQYDLIGEMREGRSAPVDSMGAEALASSRANLKEKKEYRFSVLVSVMLSSQTKDEQTAAAHARLVKFGLTPENMVNTSEEKIQELIYGVGFHRRKASYIRRTSRILIDQFDGDVPDNVDEIMKFPGVGPKMAYLFLSIAYGKVEGIAVDVHVHRITNRLGWVKTKTPEQTRLELQEWLPKEYWQDINPLLVGFGQTVCLPSTPMCSSCLLRGSCPASKKRKSV